jgi:hypothetical protein
MYQFIATQAFRVRVLQQLQRSHTLLSTAQSTPTTARALKNIQLQFCLKLQKVYCYS